ncbi:MAG: GGDEF domain-containing protein [Alphaproteobacteria bacterium]|nr:GGDEF domain-containing protein [Alphaproteobacteria bacterium]
MAPPMPEFTTTDPEIADALGLIATELARTLPDEAEPGRAALLERALAYAAAAERRIADQERRIAFLEGLSTTDELTGLLNRRGFIQQLKRVLAGARRYGETGLLIYCDLDNLKRVNDRWGHAAGDALIKRAATTLASSVRESDIVGRLGGDEFGVILIQTSRRDGAKRARTLQWLLERTSIGVEGVEVLLKASLGYEACGPEDGVEGLIARADMAMYEIKRRRRAAAEKAMARTAAE